MAPTVPFEIYEFSSLRDSRYKNFYAESHGTSPVVKIALPKGTKFMYSHDDIIIGDNELSQYSADSGYAMWTVIPDKTRAIRKRLSSDRSSMKYGSLFQMKLIGDYIIVLVSYCTIHPKYIGSREEIMKDVKLDETIYFTLNEDGQIIECQKIIDLINTKQAYVESVKYEFVGAISGMESFSISRTKRDCMPNEMTTYKCKIHEVTSKEAQKFYKNFRSFVMQLAAGKSIWRITESAKAAKRLSQCSFDVMKLIDPEHKYYLKENVDGTITLGKEVIGNLEEYIEKLAQTCCNNINLSKISIDMDNTVHVTTEDN